MKYKIKFLILFLIINTMSFGQQVSNGRGHVTLLKKNDDKSRTTMTTSTSTDYVGHVTLLRFSQLYLGGGLQMPSSTTKEGANLVNGIDFNIGYYHPIWAWEKSMISLGINAELGYNLGNGERDSKNQYTVYNLAGQSQLPTVSERGAGSPKNTSFRGTAGLQMNVHLGDKFTISPIINAGYLSTTHKSFLVEETIYPQGNEVIFKLLEQKESKTSGLGILPKLRMTYNITPRIGIWLEGNYTMGPKIKSEVTTFAPEPSAGLEGDYTLSQFEVGSYTTTKRETSYSAVGVNGGIVFSLSKPNNHNKGRHTCLICGRKHRGICKRAVIEDLEVLQLQKLIQSSDKGLYDGNSDNCDAKKGVACTDDISVKSNYDLIQLDKIIKEDNFEVTKKYIISSRFNEAINSSPINSLLIKLLESGKVTLEKVKSNEVNNQYLIKQVGKSSSESKKHNYVGHVTLLR
jgi:hypothetical protein